MHELDGLPCDRRHDDGSGEPASIDHGHAVIGIAVDACYVDPRQIGATRSRGERAQGAGRHRVVLTAHGLDARIGAPISEETGDRELAATLGPISVDDVVLDRAALDRLFHARKPIGCRGCSDRTAHVENRPFAAKQRLELPSLNTTDLFVIGSHGELEPQAIHVGGRAVQENPPDSRTRCVASSLLERRIADGFDDDDGAGGVRVDERVDLLGLNPNLVLREMNDDRDAELMRRGHGSRLLQTLVVVLSRQEKETRGLFLHPLFSRNTYLAGGRHSCAS